MPGFRSSDSFVVPTVQPSQKLPLPDRQVKSTSSPGYSPKKIVQSHSGSIQLNKPQPITFKRPALLNSNQEVPGSKLHKNLKNSSSNDLDEDGSISLMVEQFIRVIKKHGEVLQKGNRISFVVKNKTNVTSEKMERISYTLRHAKKGSFFLQCYKSISLTRKKINLTICEQQMFSKLIQRKRKQSNFSRTFFTFLL